MVNINFSRYQFIRLNSHLNPRVIRGFFLLVLSFSAVIEPQYSLIEQETSLYFYL